MKDVYMHQVYMGTTGDVKTLEYHFANMVEKGWMIDKIGLFTHRYRAIEPGKKRFFVDLLPQITAFDYPENEDAQDYRRICEESGWTFVTANKQIHVFYSEENDSVPIPIHTDNKIQAEIYLKFCRKYELFPIIYPIFMLGFLIFFQLFNSGIEIFLSNLVIFEMLGFLFFSAGYIWTVGFVLTWYLKTKRSAKLNLPMPTVNCRLARIRRMLYGAGALACLLCMLAGIVLEILGGMSAWFLLLFLLPFLAIGVGVWIRRKIDIKPRERKANKRLFIVSIIVTEVIFMSLTGFVVWRLISDFRISDSNTLGDRPTLTLQDLGIDSAFNSDFYIRGSVAVPVNYNYWEVNREGNVHTEVYRSISKFITRGLYNHYIIDLKKFYVENRPIPYEILYLDSDEAAFWGADEGIAIDPEYSTGQSLELLLLRDKTILRLSIYGAEGIDMKAAVQAVQRLWGN